MENKPENENKNKTKMRIYEDQTQLQQFIEPEWMKILRSILEKRQSALSEQYPMKTKAL